MISDCRQKTVVLLAQTVAFKTSHELMALWRKMKKKSKDLPGRFCLFDSGAEQQLLRLSPKYARTAIFKNRPISKNEMIIDR